MLSIAGKMLQDYKHSEIVWKQATHRREKISIPQSHVLVP